MFDRRLIENFDWGLMALTVLIGTVGLLVLYSAVTAGGEVAQKALFYRQTIWFFTGVAAMIGCFLFNYKHLDRWSGGVYVAAICLLVGVLLFGKQSGGAQRWLSFGPIAVQPSELMKIVMVIILARYYAKRFSPSGFQFRDLIIPALYTAVPFLLILKQPDLGTALILLLIAASVTLYLKIERRTLIYLVITGLTAMILIWPQLKGYQQQRIMTFLKPGQDPLGAGYHILQSKIAIGSGMMFGKGYLKGTQNALSFLPEHHTDFILSVLAEEWGFAGAGTLIGLYLMLLLWGLNIARTSRDSFGAILAAGITMMLFWQVFINIGMVMGLMPVVGVPLPLISYGGSSMLTVMMGVGLLLNIRMRRFQSE